MDHQAVVTEVELPSSQQGSEFDDNKTSKICLSVEKSIQSKPLVEQASDVVEELAELTSDVAEELDESTPDRNNLKENHKKIV